MSALGLIFMLTALVYALAGFGGGSTYVALLIVHGVDFRVLPSVALVCNVVVVAIGSFRALKAGYVRAARILPFCLLSAPAAWIGGRAHVSETLFVGGLAGALALAGLVMLFASSPPTGAASNPQRAGWAMPVTVGVGGCIGFVAGLVGIGGGIFLAPILHLARWADAREIAGTASVFILVNSVAGLIGQIERLADQALLSAAIAFWPMPLAVAIGGAVGAHVCVNKFSNAAIRKTTGALILIVSGRLIWRLAKA